MTNLNGNVSLSAHALCIGIFHTLWRLVKNFTEQLYIQRKHHNATSYWELIELTKYVTVSKGIHKHVVFISPIQFDTNSKYLLNVDIMMSWLCTGKTQSSIALVAQVDH